MTSLHDTLKAHVGNGSLPGGVGLVARGDQAEVAAVGSLAVGRAEMIMETLAEAGLEPEPVQYPGGPRCPKTSWLTDPDG